MAEVVESHPSDITQQLLNRALSKPKPCGVVGLIAPLAEQCIETMPSQHQGRKEMKTVIMAALLATIAVPALADPGLEMLARTLGLDFGKYTAVEMIAITEARRDNDRHLENFYLSHDNRVGFGMDPTISPGEVQVALSLDLNPGRTR
nr:hypothetical protein [Marinicella sp. W31]MDC2880140.1 hypothetical protein [Marinicella sp. W31]